MGILAVFSAIFSGMVISYDQKYGPIGIVFGLMSFFIAIGVVLILGNFGHRAPFVHLGLEIGPIIG